MDALERAQGVLGRGGGVSGSGGGDARLGGGDVVFGWVMGRVYHHGCARPATNHPVPISQTNSRGR